MDEIQKKILSALSHTNKPLMIKNIAEISGINRHTVARKLDTLEILGRVRKIEIGCAKKYMLVETVPVSSLIDISNDLIIILNEKWEVQYMNKSALIFFHQSDKTVIGKRIDFLHLEIFSSPEFIQGLKEFSFQKVKKMELEIHKNELSHWYEITIMNISIRPGSLFIAVIASNITETVVTRSKIMENEAMYRSLFEYAPIPINEVDFSQIKQYFDELKKIGLEDIRSHLDQYPDELIKCCNLVKVRHINIKSKNDYLITGGDYYNVMKYLTPLFTKETMNNLKELFVSLYEGLDYFYFPSSVITSNGKFRYFSNYVSDASPNNDLSRIYVSYLDVTEQKSLQLQLLQNNKDLIGVTEEVIAHDAEIKIQIDDLKNQHDDAQNRTILYTQLLDATHIPVIIFDSSMIITWASTEMARLMGYSDNDLYGKNIRILFPDTNGFKQFYQFIVHNESTGKYGEFSILHQSGISLPVLWLHVENITLSDGKKTYATIVQKINS
jgi:PAS domain S-box-containing protein